MRSKDQILLENLYTMTFKEFYIKENFTINLKSAIDQIEEIGYPRYIAEAVAKKAHEIFRLCGISETDFALQTVSDEIAVFGGWNRIIARQDYDDDHLWTFYIDQGLSRTNIVKNFKKLSDTQKTLEIKKESL